MRSAMRIGRGAILATAIAGAALVLAPPAAGNAVPLSAVESATVGSVATQLGVKVIGTARVDDEFTIGIQFTALLVEPAKLAAFGLTGMHAGARVVAARVSPDRVYIEADEMEPPRRASTRVTLDASGKLVRPPNA